MTTVEQELVELLDMTPPEPGERCQLCNRRRNKKRTSEEPTTRKVTFVLPADRADPVEEGLDALQELVGADGHSYPKGHLLEALVVLGAQHREDLATYFNGE